MENESYSTTWVDLKTVFEAYPQPQKWPISAPKNQKDPEIKSKLKVRIEGTLENKISSTTWVDPKTVLEPNPDPKKVH